MRIHDQHFRTIWPTQNAVSLIDQTRLPFEFVIVSVTTLAEVCHAIRHMQVRGAPLIGAAAAYGVALGIQSSATETALAAVVQQLIATRPTAVNLAWAAHRMQQQLLAVPEAARASAAWLFAQAIADEDVAQNLAIGQHGKALIAAKASVDAQQTINILTHCNAGWLATVDGGTALAPIYAAHDAGLKVHVWVDETRPRNQGASLTAWELAQHGVPHTVIADNAGGHLMQHGQVDMVIVGADRVTREGDVCNKIGTYLKALAAYDQGVPFYAAVPTPTIDWQVARGADIDIEMRDADEVAYISGQAPDGRWQRVRIIPHESTALNPAFDVTPARLVTGIITECGIFAPAQLHTLGQ
ncbi:S-methyl-5-thioribose-1-phosphate isomerase [Methylophilus medardicus]|uniref:Methylthioribose-1-phosphate isomerase n=1 Tax=Methylophilus medardicus TaxID=2588534 RepID=A0A5B8CTL9_9PROT|nr:S-methyl-5-thioribose-1-phosphate isomerase [Methylophilus medardicus]QDC44631.1 S-methyl-5-thioribose-1-phosphate isomerase [Methylophilus medardicus]QDC49638.1 S-methyl-5-thioribose-1-phosphate isomerase [Methylophilus medardicus]QDC53343.1 S-methyl-5-thioribose-1-phosphate isomerase [Methylophilus medardicus]